MSITQQRIAAIFNEWARRYSEDPESFDQILDSNGQPVTNYGERAAAYFSRIANELDAEGLLPLPADPGATNEPEEVTDTRKAIRSWGYSGPLDTVEQMIAYLRSYMSGRDKECITYATANAHLRELLHGPDAWRSR